MFRKAFFFFVEETANDAHIDFRGIWIHTRYLATIFASRETWSQAVQSGA